MEVNEICLILIFIQTVLFFVTRHVLFGCWIIYVNVCLGLIFGQLHFVVLPLCSLQTCSSSVTRLEILENFADPTPKSLPDWDQMSLSWLFLSRSLNNSSKDFSVRFRSLFQISFTHWLFKPSRIWCKEASTEHDAATTRDVCCGGAQLGFLKTSLTVIPVSPSSMTGLLVLGTYRQVLKQRLSRINCWSFKLPQSRHSCLGDFPHSLRAFKSTFW